MGKRKRPSTHTYQAGETGGQAMKGLRGSVNRSLWLGGAAALLVVCATGPAAAEPVTCSGNQEVPPVTTNATGIADVSIVLHKCPAPTAGLSCPTVIGTVSTAGIIGTA